MEASVHDPSIVKDGERYYVFGTHMTEAASEDLIHWQMKASGVTENNSLFKDLPRYHQMFLNEEGWFVTAPFAAMGEKLREKGYRSLRKLAGAYYTVEHGRDISSEIHEAEAWKFLPDGTVETADGREETWDIIKNTCYIIMTLQDHIYKGVIIEMQDEAGNDVRCFTMAGDNNETIWAVFYK